MLFNILHECKKDPNIMRRAAKVALVVGTILALINHYDVIYTGVLTSTQVLQIIITYLVPFSVATYSAARHAERIAKLDESYHSESVELIKK